VDKRPAESPAKWRVNGKNAKEAGFTLKDMPCLRQTISMAQKMG
jgi:hypothetical protein